MIAEIGHFALILALVVAVVQGTLPMIGAAQGRASWMAVARPSAQLQLLLVLTAFLALMQAYVVSDFSLANVAQNSHSAKPMLYKITGVWGNHEGSMLLWVLILALFGAAVAAFGGNLPPTLRARVLSIQALIASASSPSRSSPRTPSSGSSRCRSTAGTSIPCSRTPASPSTRPCSTPATSASRSPSPSPSRR